MFGQRNRMFIRGLDLMVILLIIFLFGSQLRGQHPRVMIHLGQDRPWEIIVTNVGDQ